MKHYVAITLLLTINLCFSQTRLDTLIKVLGQEADYDKICRAKNEIEKFEKDAIPHLITLLKDTSSVQVTNTADLIYPGAQKFYGHGVILNYAINSIAVRAGWCIEEITFNDFGYRDRSVDENQLIKLLQDNYKEYSEKGYRDVDFQNRSKKTQLKIYYLILADSVSKWWSKNKNIWTTASALKSALASNNDERQNSAINYLSNCLCVNYSDKDQKEIKDILFALEKKRKTTLVTPELFSPYNIFVKGIVTNSDTDSPLEKALIEVFDMNSKPVRKVFTDKSGHYTFGLSLEAPDDYLVKISFSNYIHKIFTISTENIPSPKRKEKSSPIQADLSLNEKVRGVDYSVLDKPINHYYYRSTDNRFIYDNHLLEESIKSQLSIEEAEKKAKQK